MGFKLQFHSLWALQVHTNLSVLEASQIQGDGLHMWHLTLNLSNTFQYETLFFSIWSLPFTFFN